jgi:hypothetical protein
MKLQSVFIAIGLAIIIFLLLPSQILSPSIEANKVLEMRSYPYSNFNKIKLSSAFEAELTRGNEFKVVIETSENVFPQIEAQVENGELQLSLKKGINHIEKLKAYITLPHLISADLSGASSLHSKSQFTEKLMEIEMSGASSMNLLADVDQLDVDISGASDVELKGKGQYFELESSGASEANFESFVVKQITVDLSGASNCTINVLERIEGEISGASDLIYLGNPSTVNIEKSGASSVHRR